MSTRPPPVSPEQATVENTLTPRQGANLGGAGGVVPSTAVERESTMPRRNSFANVTAGVALFVALGGRRGRGHARPRQRRLGPDRQGRRPLGGDRQGRGPLPRDYRGRCALPGDRRGAVRSSEIRDRDIRLIDLSTHALDALQGATGPQGPAGVTELRVAQDSLSDVAHCADQELIDCPNLLTRTLGAGNRLIEAKLDVANLGAQPVLLGKCGLVQGSSVPDRTSFHLDPTVEFADIEDIALTAVLTDVANGTTVALRCSEQTGEDILAEDMKLTALKVTTVTGP